MLPNLLNPTDVVVRLLDKTTTHFSNTAREAKGKKIYSAEVTLPCQPFIGKVDDAQFSPAGVDEKVDGYIVVRPIDMASLLSRSLDRGDKIVALGSGTNKQDVEYFIVGSKLGAAYSDQNGFSLRKYFFSSRITDTPGGSL